MPTGWDSILTVILFGDSYTDGLEMLLVLRDMNVVRFINLELFKFLTKYFKKN